MKRLSASIGSLMIVIAIIAAVWRAMGALRVTGRGGTAYEGQGAFTFGVPPMAGVLAIGLLLILRGLRRIGECSAFLVGFEVFGTVALLIFLTISIWSDGDLLLRYHEATLLSMSEFLGDESSRIAFLLGWPLLLLFPQLLLALVGGWLSQKLGTKLVIDRRHLIALGKAPNPVDQSPV